MADGLRIAVDTTRINALLRELAFTTSEARQAVRRGLSAAGGVIRRQARANLRTVTGRDGRAINYRPLERFVRMTVYKDLGGVRVDILGRLTRRQQRSYSKRGIRDLAYTLKWLDLGTEARYNKAGGRLSRRRYTGRMQASRFFQKAVETKAGEAQGLLGSAIEEQINRIARRRR